MKTLKERGNKIIVHKNRKGIFVRKNCKCGRVHLLMKREQDRYLRCRCERLMEL